MVVRCRPLNSTETKDGRQKIVLMDYKTGTITLAAAASERNIEPPKTFTFDQVYDENSTQENIYVQTASRIVDSVLEGFNGTIFACAPAPAAWHCCLAPAARHLLLGSCSYACACSCSCSCSCTYACGCGCRCDCGCGCCGCCCCCCEGAAALTLKPQR